MDLRFTEEQERFRTELRSWIDSNLERPWSAEVRDPKHTPDSLVELRRAWQRKLNAAGYLGMGWPAEWGGRGATKDPDILALEQDVTALLGLEVAIDFQGQGGKLTIHYQTLEQLDGVLRRLSHTPPPEAE